MQLLKRLFSTTIEDALQSEINALQERLNKAERENERLQARLSTQPLTPNNLWEADEELSNGSPNLFVRKYLKDTAAKNCAYFPKKPHIPVNRSCYPQGVQQIIGESSAWNNVVYLILWNLDIIREDYVAALLSEINGKDYKPYYIKNITRGARYTSDAIYNHAVFKSNVQ
ncbi:hypothetical protein [Aeromonas veronii]|uniref:hypothetical protein n=1 Tax=Aeromonas veronii TaxID=654 RepID=UPI000B59B7AA|nr:hypothetical protein [Aeromonas veronii]